MRKANIPLLHCSPNKMERRETRREREREGRGYDVTKIKREGEKIFVTMPIAVSMSGSVQVAHGSKRCPKMPFSQANVQHGHKAKHHAMDNISGAYLGLPQGRPLQKG